MADWYDRAYRSCPCFWGNDPGRIVRLLVASHSMRGLRVLDVGCGEGKNAEYLARLGARVDAFDKSGSAIAHARTATGGLVNYTVDDVLTADIPARSYDVVIAYGLLHCLSTPSEIRAALERLQGWTADMGFNVIATLNSRFSLLGRAHADFHPTLLDHRTYIDAYRRWSLMHVSDEDLEEEHPHDHEWHTHSITRILARRLEDVHPR